MPTDTLAPSDLKRGREVELTLTDFADRGKSLARVGEGDGGFVVFVAGAVPGDRVRARVFKRKKGFAEARLLEVLEPSELRTEPRCEYAASCGGCKWQHVEYPAQLAMKGEQAVSALTRARLDLSAADVRPPLGGGAYDGSGGVYFYRNKMEFSFSAMRWLTDWEIATGEEMDTDFALGLHVPGRFDKVLDLKACYLQSEWSARLVNGVRAFAKAQGWSPWHPREHTGYLRILALRTPGHTDDRMVNLVTSFYDEPRMAAFADFLRAEFPEVTTLVNTINSGVAQTAFGEAVHTVFGSGLVRDKIGPHTFEIASNAFFQTNTVAAEGLYAVAREFANLQPDDVVYDLYCGAGTISLFVADQVKRVVGVELVEEAVENARASAEANGVANCTFVAGDMLELLKPELVEEHGRPDVLIVDPPRAGMHPKVVGQIAHLRPERIVYVSCNPQTQARDLAMLQEAAAYTIEAVQPVDMFPHTHHVESVVGLRLT
ncbi:23S rRNA (uracil(1939)-C(5))-methyltransferase RlmD [Rubrivirga marina]|uniref:23S rRNA (Uracil-5-)-methyltransferase RumA n=1 Tax=Rubrivirga marina TaxID=1196024 RepID=A0A271IZB7_9BACT|nr:23S rRNA (uracil(1939)-C(5))-methyltransferase RlmD [Rubrivirga marina]PAP76586.1 23S rRNA (uracil-5-)-methyltransferase RumA [Rubrivirga marina]